MPRLVKGSTPPCSISGCGALAHGRGLCNKHYKRWKAHGNAETTLIREAGEGTPHISGYWVINGRLRHVLICERALGKPLPAGAEVHHVDQDRSNDSPSNLVICPSKSYHQLLHRRTRALEACGNADWVRCWLCREYSDPGALLRLGASFAHRECSAAYYRDRKSRRMA